MSKLSCPHVYQDAILRQCFVSRRFVQDAGGVLVGCTVGLNGPGILSTATSSRVTYDRTQSLLINSNKMTVRVRLHTTGPALASNPVLISKGPSALNDNQFAVALASGGGGRPYIDIANAAADVSQYCIATSNLLNSTDYVLHWVYDGSLAAANRIALYANGAAIGQSIGGTIPTTMRASASPLCMFQRAGGAAAAPPTDMPVYDFAIWNRALSAADVALDAADRTYWPGVP